MFPKANRLKREKDFERILRNGKTFKEGFLILRIVKNNINQTRFGVSVSKKISKKATLRNKIKRRLLSLLKPRSPKIKTGVDIFLIALPGLETKDFWEIKEMIHELFTKAKILQNDSRCDGVLDK